MSLNSAGSIFFIFYYSKGYSIIFFKNTVGIFKDIVDKDGNGIFLIWK
jgi:hypothetical protein